MFINIHMDIGERERFPHFLGTLSKKTKKNCSLFLYHHSPSDKIRILAKRFHASKV